MSELNRIPEQGEEQTNTTVYQTIVKPARIKAVSKESLVNGILLSIVVILLLSILAT